MGVSDSSTDESPGPSECRSRPTCQTAWATSYLIPWEKFPKSFLTSCKNNRSPSQSDRREVVRILVDDITGVCSRPTSRDIYIVSSKLVDTYKTSLMDRFGDTRIGSGYSSFINRIQDRLNNLNRKRLSSGSGCSKSPATKRGYGWLTEAIFEEIPREEYLDSKEFLKRQARFTDVDFSLITEVMNKTYPLQREEISRGDMSIAEIEKNWPFLFTKTCALKHFEKLTGVNLPREFFVHSSSKIKTLLKYMEKLEGSRKEIKKIFEEVEEFKKITETNYPDTQCFVKLIFSYFKEDGFLEYYPQMCDQKNIEDKARTEGAPVIAVVGNLYTSTLFHVIVESKSIQVLEKLDDALLLMFAVYYILDLKYLKAASSSLEFLQRVCFGINPTRGSKGGKRKNTRNSVNAQVLQLISELRGFELDQLDS
ncbi:uncharacterized protein LOC130012875 isoform X2 [Patella vulgata]|nr:uncharacterized protein LOC126811872 isoform X3 [Patella vulgata]XP_055956901.1 uncharacterized protein LOC130012875 isoform X2 [Patella vulgata]